MKRILAVFAALALALVFCGSAFGQCSMGGSGGGHQHSSKEQRQHQQVDMPMSHGLVKSYSVDGYGVSFNLMEKGEFLKMAEKMDDGETARHEQMMAGDSGTHHLAVIIVDEKTGERLENATLALKLINPSNQRQASPWGWMENHYCGYLNLNKAGEYAILTGFKAGGQEHSVGFTYELEKPKSGDVRGKEVYTCPMHPEIARNKPGNCPICGMTLVKK